MREVYADHAATTAPAPEVLASMSPWLGGGFGNASSVHARGERARDAIEHARAQVAALIGGVPEEVVFTATGSEANNLALQGVLAVSPPGRRRLVISAVEHPSVLETARALERDGVALTIVPVDDEGVVDLVSLEAAMGPDVALVSLMLANNEVGALQPVAEAARLAHACGARVHTDAVQACGRVEVDVEALGVDLLTLAGHKFHGPLGAAALWVRRRVRLAPLVHGGHQERSRRAGTENLPAIVGLGTAAALAGERLAAEAPRIRALADALWDGIAAREPSARRNGDPARALPGIVNVTFPGLDGEALLHALDRRGVTVSTGSACSAASPGASHVLLAMGRRPEDAYASVRFSLGGSNDANDVAHVLRVLPECLSELRVLRGAVESDGREGNVSEADEEYRRRAG